MAKNLKVGDYVYHQGCNEPAKVTKLLGEKYDNDVIIRCPYHGDDQDNPKYLELTKPRIVRRGAFDSSTTRRARLHRALDKVLDRAIAK